MQFFVSMLFSTPGGKYQEASLLDRMIKVCFFSENAEVSCKVAVPFCIPSDEQEFLLSTSLSALGVVRVLDVGRRDRCIVVSPCLNLQFPDAVHVDRLLY